MVAQKKSWRQFWNEIREEEREKRFKEHLEEQRQFLECQNLDTPEKLQARRELFLRRMGDGTDSDLTGNDLGEGWVEGLINDDDWLSLRSYGDSLIGQEDSFEEWVTTHPHYLFLKDKKKINPEFVRRFFRVISNTRRLYSSDKIRRLDYLRRAGFDIRSFDGMLYSTGDFFHLCLKRHYPQVLEQTVQILQKNLCRRFRKAKETINHLRKS